MPKYDYLCPSNGEVVEVTHRISEKLVTWGELCERSGVATGQTPPEMPIERIFLTAPMANTPIGNAGIKDLGFTKLVKRDDGVYENVTRSGSESRYARAGDPSSMPHLSKKLGDS